MKKLNLDKVKEAAGKLRPKKEARPEAEAEPNEAAGFAVEVGAAAAVEPEKPEEKAKKPLKAPKQPKAKQTSGGKPGKKKPGKAADECVFRFPTWEQMKDPAFGIPTAAGVFLILAWCFAKNPLVRGILGGISAILTLYILFPELLRALKAKDWRSEHLISVLAAVLFALSGGIPGAAAALLLWLVGQKTLDRVKRMKRSQLEARRVGSPLGKELPGFEPSPIPAGDAERDLKAYFPILAIFLAAIVAIIAALLGLGIHGALRRAAAILMLGCTASFFAGFPFGDLSALLSAAENGVLFRKTALTRALRAKLCCVTEAQPELFGEVAVYPAMPEKLNGEALVRLARLALSQSEGIWSEKLAAICEVPSAEGLETRSLEGFGVAAKVQNLSILCGSAEFMVKAGLPMLPFRDGDRVLHIGVNSFYAGCMELGEAELGDDAVGTALAESGFFRFADAEEAAAKREGDECILFAAPDGKPEGCRETDLYVSAGAYLTEADVILGRCGAAGILGLTAELKKAERLRQLLVRLALYGKLVLFLLAVFGACPLWLAVLLELGLSAFGVFFASKAPKVKE